MSDDSSRLRQRSSSLLQLPTSPKHYAASERSNGTSPASFHFSNPGEVSTAPTSCSTSDTNSQKSGCSDDGVRATAPAPIASTPCRTEDWVGEWLSADDAPTAPAVFSRAAQQNSTPVRSFDQIPIVVLDTSTVVDRAGSGVHDANTVAATIIGVGEGLQQLQARSLKQAVSSVERVVRHHDPAVYSTPASIANTSGGLQVPVAALLLLLLALTVTTAAVCFSVNADVIRGGYIVIHHMQESVSLVGIPIIEAIAAACAIVVALRIYQCFLIVISLLLIISLWTSLWILQWIAMVAGYEHLKQVLPLVIAGQEVEVFVDSGGLNLMSTQTAADFNLKPTGSKIYLMTVFGNVFPSPGEVTTTVSFVGQRNEEPLTFRVVDIPFQPITVNKAFRDRHDLIDPLHPYYLYRPYTARELLSSLLAVVSVTDTHDHNIRDFLRIELPLACGDVESVMVLLDSGSAVDAFSLAFVTKYFPKGQLRKCSKYVKCVDGTRKNADRKIEVAFLVNGRTITREFFVFADLKVDAILGGLFDIAYQPHTSMSDQIISKELQIPGARPPAAYHFGMEHVGKGSSLILRAFRHLKKQPAPPPSAAIEAELDRARKTEIELQSINSQRISNIDDDTARTAARFAERTRHLEAFGAIELISGRLREALAVENGSIVPPAVPRAPNPGPVTDPAIGPFADPATRHAADLGAGALPHPNTGPMAHTAAGATTSSANDVPLDAAAGPANFATVPLPLTRQPLAETDHASMPAMHPEAIQEATDQVTDVAEARTDVSAPNLDPPAVQQPSLGSTVVEAVVPVASAVTTDIAPGFQAASQGGSVADSQTEGNDLVNGLVSRPSDIAFASSTTSTSAPSHRSGSDISPPEEQSVGSNDRNVTNVTATGTEPTSEALPTAVGVSVSDNLGHAINHNGVVQDPHQTFPTHDTFTISSLKRASTH